MTLRTATTSLHRPVDGSGEAQLRSADQAEISDESELWAHKRQRQRRDLGRLQAGLATEDEMSWFSGGRARACRLLNSLY